MAKRRGTEMAPQPAGAKIRERVREIVAAIAADVIAETADRLARPVTAVRAKAAPLLIAPGMRRARRAAAR